MQQKTLVGFFTEDLEALEQEAVCTPEFGNGRMFYYYMKEGSSNASSGVGWGGGGIPGKNNRKGGYHQLFLFWEKLLFQSRCKGMKMRVMLHLILVIQELSKALKGRYNYYE